MKQERQEDEAARDLKYVGRRAEIVKKRRERMSDMEKRHAADWTKKAATRPKKETMFDILLSGTSATLVIQTVRRVYIGWVGDTLVAMQGSERNIQQHFTKSNDLFFTYPPHRPDLLQEKMRIYN